MGVCVIYFFVTFRIVLATYNSSHHNELNSFKMTITPERNVNVTEGKHVHVLCSISNPIGHSSALYWQAQGKTDSLIQQKRVNDSTVMLVVTHAVRSDAGFYRCIYNNSKDPVMWKGVFISVISKSKGAQCAHTQFLCETDKHCIFIRFRCNGKEDCKDGSDEKKCDECDGKFRCHSGKCINMSLVCDDNHSNDCGDWSDEYCLMANKYKTEKTTTYNITAKDKEDNMTWLKTTVYVVIGCTVSVVLFISIIVIAVFRIRMKKDACRHTERALSRMRPVSGTHGNDGGDVRRGVENDPFIPPSLAATYGNIIVNVNNGVQYVPGIDFTPVLCPPTYSDVERETRERQGSPPPDYTTLDRNPQCPSLLFVGSSNNNILNCVEESPTSLVASNPNTNNDSFSDMEIIPTVSSVGTQTPPASVPACGRNRTGGSDIPLPSANSVHTSDALTGQTRQQPNLDIQGGAIVITGDRGLMQREPVEQHIVRRSRLLQVQDGNLILSGEETHDRPSHSQGSSELNNENLNYSESTALLSADHASDINDSQRSENPAHLEVHDGEIVLTNQIQPAAHMSPDSMSLTRRRDIGVQEGQIVFR